MAAARERAFKWRCSERAAWAVTYAEQCTVNELPAVLDGAPLPEKGTKSHHSIHLRLTPRQYEVFEATLLKHGAKRPKKGRGLVNKENALTKALTVSFKARSTMLSGRQE